ncbi:MAG: bacterial Ig-like domain-containing protein, partial [Clostridia bacterium]|nr:bacterial Ig-like domain-containing protein [Clostridia bacterium]
LQGQGVFTLVEMESIRFRLVTHVVPEINIEKHPDRTEYKKGDKLDTTGMVVTAKYASGKTETVTSACYISPRDLNGTGSQKITVVYKGLTDYFYVTVTE